MSWKKRPSIRELQLKIDSARKCLALNKCYFGPNVKKLVDEFTNLNLGDSSEVWPLLAKLLEEITPDNYAGTHPPMKAIDVITNTELFVFVWDSKHMKQSMYAKFAIKNDFFYYFSLHKSERPAKCWKFTENVPSK